MDLRELARFLGRVAGQVDEMKESLRLGVMKRLEVDKLFYYLPDAEEEDTSALEKEVKRALGGDSLEDAIREAFKSRRRVVRMGGRRLAVIFTGGGLEGDKNVPLKLMDEVELGGRARKFDASSYPLATLQEVIEFDPDVVVLLSVERGEEVEVSARRLSIEVPENSREVQDMVSLLLLGINDPETLAGALLVMSEDRKMEIWTVTCTSPHVEGSEISEVGEECQKLLKGKMKELLKELGF